MNKLDLENSAQNVLNELENYIVTFNRNPKDWPIEDTKIVVELLIKKINRSDNIISERVLRAMHDIAAMSIKNFEDTILDERIDALHHQLWEYIPEYRNLDVLGVDFGKGEPI